jgi:hypothetical protein
MSWAGEQHLLDLTMEGRGEEAVVLLELRNKLETGC